MKRPLTPDDEESVDDEESADSSDDEWTVYKEKSPADYDPNDYACLSDELLSNEDDVADDEEAAEEPKTPVYDRYEFFPRDTWLSLYPGDARLEVSVPKIEKKDVNIEPDVIEIHVDSLKRTVVFLKEEIARKLNIPCARICLTWKLGLMDADHLPLSAYNVKTGDRLFLTLGSPAPGSTNTIERPDPAK